MPIALAMILAVQPAAEAARTRAAACAAADVVRIPPGDMLQMLDDFRAKLPIPDRRRLDRALPRDADGGITSCDSVEGSRAACEVQAYRPALRRTGLMRTFTTTICPPHADGH